MTRILQSFRLRRWILVASLAANLLLIGLIVGVAASGRDGPPRGFEPQVGALGQVLNKTQKAEIGRALRDALRESDVQRPRRSALVMTVAGILQAEDFDRAAFTQAITQEYRSLDRVRDIALVTFADYIAEMSVQERREMAALLQDRSRGKDRPQAPGDRAPDRN